MRVSPSGKAVASQATIRGFESHHPLSNCPVAEPLKKNLLQHAVEGFLSQPESYSSCKQWICTQLRC